MGASSESKNELRLGLLNLRGLSYPMGLSLSHRNNRLRYHFPIKPDKLRMFLSSESGALLRLVTTCTLVIVGCDEGGGATAGGGIEDEDGGGSGRGG